MKVDHSIEEYSALHRITSSSSIEIKDESTMRYMMVETSKSTEEVGVYEL